MNRRAPGSDFHPTWGWILVGGDDGNSGGISATVDRSMDYGATWQRLSVRLRQKRTTNCAAFLNASHVFVFGGYTGGVRIGSPEILDLENGGVSKSIQETPSGYR